MSEFSGERWFHYLSCTIDDKVNVVLLSQNQMKLSAFACYGEAKVEVRGPKGATASIQMTGNGGIVTMRSWDW